MNKKTILIVPPRGVPVKSIKVRLSVAILFLVLVIGGFAGYFIPFNSFTLNVVEQNQKKNLAEQNKALLQKILSTLRLLNSLKEQVAKLEDKREHVIRFGSIDTQTISVHHRKVDFSKFEPDALLRYTESLESRLESFVATVNENNNLFNKIPVIYPVPGPFIVSRSFGVSKDPFTSKDKWHYGTDFVAEIGTAIVATASGVVTRVENHPIWGKRIYIDHDEGFSTVYAHLGTTTVSRGKQVKRGETIGTMGMSGLSTGPHVHYEIWKKGTAINPDDYFYPRYASGEIALR